MVHSGRVLPRHASLAELELHDGVLLTLVVKPASSFVMFGTAGGSVNLFKAEQSCVPRTSPEIT